MNGILLEQVAQEASGLILWLRPEYQNPVDTQSQQTSLAVSEFTVRSFYLRSGLASPIHPQEITDVLRV